jgi:hypothetical protein
MTLSYMQGLNSTPTIVSFSALTHSYRKFFPRSKFLRISFRLCFVLLFAPYLEQYSAPLVPRSPTRGPGRPAESGTHPWIG